MATDSPPGEAASSPHLVLWDIDRTLVTIGGGVSRAAYELAFRQVTGKPLGELPDMSGRTDRAILKETLRLNGVEQTETLFGEFYAALATATRRLTDRMREAGTVLPGAREAIASCSARHTVQSAVTGNIRPVAMAKLGALGLGDGIDFAVGGYGDDSSDRADLVRQARERASEKYGHGFAGRLTVVIGDTPHDVRGALDAGALAVAVATGKYTTEELRRAGADIVLTDLRDFASRCGPALGW